LLKISKIKRKEIIKMNNLSKFDMLYIKKAFLVTMLTLLTGVSVLLCANSFGWAEQSASGYGSHGHANGTYAKSGHYGKSTNSFKYYNADNHKAFVEQDQYFTNDGVNYKKVITSTPHQLIAKGTTSPAYKNNTQVLLDNNYSKAHARMFFVLDIPARTDIMSIGCNTSTINY
jgi:hypothetical protein